LGEKAIPLITSSPEASFELSYRLMQGFGIVGSAMASRLSTGLKGKINTPQNGGQTATKGASKTIGKPFDPNGKVVQEGVDPNTLKPGKKLDTLDPKRQKDAVKYGGDKPIIVDRNGNVLDGHHRLNDAIQNGRAVDVQIGY